MRVPVPFGISFGAGRSHAGGMQSLVNLYAEQVEAEGRTNIILYPTPGLASFATIGGSAPRGQITAGDVHYAVVGDRLYSVTSAGATTDLGEIEGDEPVDMAFNGVQLGIVADLKSYFYDTISLALTEISDPNFEQASCVASLASYLVFGVKGTGRFRWILVNSTSFNANDFATAEAEADNLVSIRKVGNELALLGATSVEWWYPTGLSGADAFAKTSTAAAPYGCLARDTARIVDGGLTWVGLDGTAGGRAVYRAGGYTPTAISTPEVVEYLQAAVSAGALTSFVYQMHGQLNYVLTNPSEWTLVWSLSKGEGGQSQAQWGYRKSGSFSMGAEPTGGWDAVTFALNGSKQIVGRSDGNLYELQADTYLEDDDPIVREFTTAQIYRGGRRCFQHRLELEFETNVALTTGQGSNPLVYESHSDDGGNTWSNPRQATLGVVGQTKWRATWNAMGSFRQRIHKIRCSDPIKFVPVNLHCDMSVGAH